MEVFQLFQRSHPLVVEEEVVPHQAQVEVVDPVVVVVTIMEQVEVVIHLQQLHLKETMEEQETLM